MFGGKDHYAFTAGASAGIAMTSTGDKFVWAVPFRCRPLRSGVTITAACVSSANIVVKFDRLQDGATRGNGDLGSISIPTGTAIGAAYYENSDYVAAGTGAWPQYLDEGEQIVAEVTTAAAGDGAAGSMLPWLFVEIDPERPANNTAMTAG